MAESLIARFGPELLRHAHAHADERMRAIAREWSESIATTATRERRMSRRVAAYGSSLVQAGLFDSRALKQKWAGDEHREAIRGESEARAHLLEADSSVYLAREPELVMLLILCSQG